jgi:F-type H+-transporting ATPase subunit g
MAPPTQLSAWANAYSAIFARATNVGFWRDLLRTGGWVGLGVAVSQAYTRP